jgi:hypothetical protein
LRQKILDMAYSEWKKMGFSKGYFAVDFLTKNTYLSDPCFIIGENITFCTKWGYKNEKGISAECADGILSPKWTKGGDEYTHIDIAEIKAIWKTKE